MTRRPKPKGGIGSNQHSTKGSPKPTDRRSAQHLGSFEAVASATAHVKEPTLTLDSSEAKALLGSLYGTEVSPSQKASLIKTLQAVSWNPEPGHPFDDDCADFMIAVLQDQVDGQYDEAFVDHYADAARSGLEALAFGDKGSPASNPNVAHALSVGFTQAEALTLVGLGQRRNPDCLPVDTVANKLAAGALSPSGAKQALEGSSPKPNLPTTAGLAVSSLTSEEQKQVRPMVPQQTLTQLGDGAILSVSGGRVDRTVNGRGETTSIVLPVDRGRAVEVVLAANDTYTVRDTQMGIVSREVTDIYFDGLAEATISASDSSSGFGAS